MGPVASNALQSHLTWEDEEVFLERMDVKLTWLYGASSALPVAVVGS